MEAAEVADDEEGPDIEIPQAVTQVREREIELKRERARERESERARERESERELARCRWPLQRHHL
jgi:hypothetical protein